MYQWRLLLLLLLALEPIASFTNGDIIDGHRQRYQNREASFTNKRSYEEISNYGTFDLASPFRDHHVSKRFNANNIRLHRSLEEKRDRGNTRQERRFTRQPANQQGLSEIRENRFRREDTQLLATRDLTNKEQCNFRDTIERYTRNSLNTRDTRQHERELHDARINLQSRRDRNVERQDNRYLGERNNAISSNRLSSLSGAVDRVPNRVTEFRTDERSVGRARERVDHRTNLRTYDRSRDAESRFARIDDGSRRIDRRTQSERNIYAARGAYQMGMGRKPIRVSEERRSQSRNTESGERDNRESTRLYDTFSGRIQRTTDQRSKDSFESIRTIERDFRVENRRERSEQSVMRMGVERNINNLHRQNIKMEERNRDPEILSRTNDERRVNIRSDRVRFNQRNNGERFERRVIREMQRPTPNSLERRQIRSKSFERLFESTRQERQIFGKSIISASRKTFIKTDVDKTSLVFLWHYLLYTFQALYLCSIVTHWLNRDEFGMKNKGMIQNWFFGSQKMIKMD